jgi:hypothetical protein
MERVVVDTSASAKLDGADRQVVITDPSGRMLGYFLSPHVLAAFLAGRFEGEPSLEEIDAARDDYLKHGGYTTDQVLAHLGDLKRWSEEHRR